MGINHARRPLNPSNISLQSSNGRSNNGTSRTIALRGVAAANTNTGLAQFQDRRDGGREKDFREMQPNELLELNPYSPQPPAET